MGRMGLMGGIEGDLRPWLFWCVCSCTQYFSISVWLVVPCPFLVRCRVVALPVLDSVVMLKIPESVRLGARPLLVPMNVVNWQSNKLFWGCVIRSHHALDTALPCMALRQAQGNLFWRPV